MSMNHVQSARSGFTLMEILIAVAIVAIMAVTVGPNIMNRFFGAQKSAAKTSLKGLQDSLQNYYLDNNKYPDKLRDLVKKPANAKNWSGPYLKTDEVPEDPWGNRFVYKRTPGGKKPYELYSYGSQDGKETPKEDWISVWDI